jgi:hypothetical protein
MHILHTDIVGNIEKFLDVADLLLFRKATIPRSVVHGPVGTTFRAIFVKPSHDVEVTVDHGIVHGRSGTSLGPVLNI